MAYEITPKRRDLIIHLCDGHEKALFHLFRFTRLPIPNEAIDAIFYHFKMRGLRGESLFLELRDRFEFRVVNAAAKILQEIKNDPTLKPLFANKPIF